jgi:hypothetical protein
MRQPRALALSLPLCFGLMSPALTQSPPGQPAAFLEVLTTTVRPGGVPEFEDFVKKVVAGANKIDAAQRWSTYAVSLGGPGFTYNIALPFSKWGEVDAWTAASQILSKAYGEAEGTRTLKAGRASMERSETAVYRLLPELSTRPRVFDPPAAFLQLFVTDVEPAMVPTWEDYLARLKAAQEKSPQAPTAIRRVTVEGTSNTYVTAAPFNSFAERDSWPTNQAVLRAAYGDDEARRLNETRLRCTRNARLVVMSYRADLSRPATASR